MQRIAALRVAPVKALGSVLRDRIALETQGVAEDRRLFLLGSDGSVVTQRKHPRLAGVAPDLDLQAGTLGVAFPDGTTVTSTMHATGETLHASLFGKDRSGRLVPGQVADALSDFVAEPLKLVLADVTGNGWDEGPVSILTRASAEAVDPPSEKPGGIPGSPDTARFRMLVEVDGAEPYEEDSWVGRPLRLGEALVRVTHSLERCVVINHSPATGQRDWAGVKTLALRRGRELVCLGVIAQVERPGELRVGDVVQVLS
ncbi:MAG TPA: MOSC N-terminal beta barrel domain-containing protein [Nocardioidaceae bacterium]|nr:MOSC N-terminal beta barrel domain-containing protein [Nocardioidaceae bacterium]